MRKVCHVLLVLATAAGTAWSDVLLLKGGGRVEGVVVEEGDCLVVRMVHGAARVKKSDVAARERVPYVTEVFAEKRARLDPGDAEGHVVLAEWCRARGLSREATELLRRAVEIDPDHAEARAALGQERFGEEWLPVAEARTARLRAAGFLEVNGRFDTGDGLRARLEAQAETLALAGEEARRQAEREAAEREERLAKELLLKAEAERKAAEAAVARAEEDREERERLDRENEELRRLVRDLVRDLEDDGWWYGYGLGYGWPRILSWGAGSVGVIRDVRHGGGPWSGLGFGFRFGRSGSCIRGFVR